MDCAELDALLSEHTLAELTPEQRAAVAAHSAGCEACRQKWGLDAQSQAFHDGAKALGPQRSLKDAILAKLDAEPPQPGAPPAENGHPKLKRLGGFELLGRIGKGGMGTVLKARQVILDRLVAVKVLPKKLAQNEAYVQRFLREARSAAQLSHPNIVQAIDAGFAEGYYYFAMEFVDGETLDAIRGREGALDPHRALQLLKQVTSALAAAHDAGIVHRDIKPSNIMIGRNGEARVADFGLAKRVEGDISITATGVALGTPMYLSPEMATGKEVDGRADLYSLGATFFHLLAGRPPFEGQTSTQVIVKHVTDPAPSLASLAPHVDPRLCRTIDRLLLKEPADRYPSAHVLLRDLEALGSLQSPPFPAEAGPGAEMLRAQATRELPAAPAAPRGRRTAHPPPPAMPGGQPHSRPRRRLSLVGFGAAAGLAALFVIMLVAALVRTGSDTPHGRVITGYPGAETPKGPEKEPDKEPGQGPTKEPPKEEQPKGKGKPKEVEKPPEALTPEARLAEAKKSTEALLKEAQFGKAIATMEALAEDIGNAELKKQAEAAVAAIRKRAAEAYNAARDSAVGLAAQGKFAEARTKLQAVADQFGTEQEVGLAKAALAALGEHEQAAAALAKAAEQATADATAAAKRAAREANLAKALAPIGELLAKWDFAAAAQQLAAIKADDEAAGELATRKAAIEATAAVQAKMIQAIKSAQPRLKCSQVRIPGAGGELIAADPKSITVQSEFKIGDDVTTKTHKVPWTALRDVSIEGLFERAADANDPADQLGSALLLNLAGSEKKAVEALRRAERLGAKTDRATDFGKADKRITDDTEAAQALANALKTLAANQQKGAAAALEDYQKKFAETARFAASKKLLDAALALKPFSPPAAALPEEAPKPPETKQPEAKPPPGKQGQGWISLFDGKTLGQWKPVGGRGFQAQAPAYVQDGCIVLEPGRPITGVRWDGDFPRMDYEVTMEAQRVAGNDGFCNVYFPYGATHSMISVGCWGGPMVGILLVDGVDVHLNPTRRDVEFQRGIWYALKLRVTSARVQFWIGPACVVDFDTRGHVLAPDDYNRWARLAPFGLASWETKAAIRNIRLRHLTQVPE